MQSTGLAGVWAENDSTGRGNHARRCLSVVGAEAVLPFEVGWVQCGLGPEAQVVLDGTRFTLGRSMLDAGGYQWRVDLHEAVVFDFQGNGLIELAISREGLLIPASN
jgi:hypothetical protein